MSKMRVTIDEAGTVRLRGGYVWFGAGRVHMRDFVVKRAVVDRELERIKRALDAMPKETT
jgi:hypothetical protein